VTGFSCPHDVRTKIVRKSAAAAVNFQPVAGYQRVDPTELQHAFGATFETTQNRQQIGNDHIVTFAHRLKNLSASEHTSDFTEPALQHFDVDSQRQSIQAADFNLL